MAVITGSQTYQVTADPKEKSTEGRAERYGRAMRRMGADLDHGACVADVQQTVSGLRVDGIW